MFATWGRVQKFSVVLVLRILGALTLGRLVFYCGEFLLIVRNLFFNLREALVLQSAIRQGEYWLPFSSSTRLECMRQSFDLLSNEDYCMRCE